MPLPISRRVDCRRRWRQPLRRGEQRHAEWLAERERRMAAAMATVEDSANADERRRIDRFRSNVLRRTKPFHSTPTHFHFPELIEREFHPRALFPWLETIEQATETIAAELAAVMAAERAELVPYIQYEDHLPLDQWRELNRNADWTAIHLWRNGERVEANGRHCPATMELLAGLPQPRVAGAGPNAMFSLLAPNTAHPAPCRREQCAAGVPLAAGRAGGLLVSGRRRDPSLAPRRSVRVRRYDRA